MPEKVRKHYANYGDLVELSQKQLTYCTSYEYLTQLGQASKIYESHEEHIYKLYGCQGGTWEGVAYLQLASVAANGSFMPLGHGTDDDCDQGFIKVKNHDFFTNGGIMSAFYLKEYLREFLKVSPVGVAMQIPGCNGGKLDTRGGRGGVCDRDGQCNGHLVLFRECSDTDIMKAYEHSDIVMSDSDNKCQQNYSSLIDNVIFKYNHDAVVVGLGRQSIYQYWLVKQSWGSNFGHGGYMKIQATARADDAPFCI